MAEQKNYSSLSERVGILVANLISLYIPFVWASGLLLPSGGLESTWIISAFALWLLNMLSAPWFVPPRDTLSNAITAAAILVTMDLSAVHQFGAQLDVVRWVATAYCVTAIIVSVVALVLHDRDARSIHGRLWYRISALLGRGEILYTPPALISILGAYQTDYPTIAWLLLLWVLFTVAKPIERLADARRLWRADNKETANSPSVGIIDRIDAPDVFRVRLTQGKAWERGTLHVAAMPNGDQSYIFALFSQIQGEEVIGTGLSIAKVQDRLTLLPGHVCLSHNTQMANGFLEQLSGSPGAELIGFIVENSTISTIRFEAAASVTIAEGDVVFVRIGNEDIFYQIVDAETAEESFDKNPRGTHIVLAAQLGRYAQDNGFTKYPWLPQMNSPIFFASGRVFPIPSMSDREFSIGTVPSTNIQVVANIDSLVEYHTAVLGVTGTGKTEVALDIVREAIARGTKVFCVDFTGEYRERLRDLIPIFPSPSSGEGEDLEQRLFDVETGQYGAGPQKKELRELLDALRAGAATAIQEFLSSTDQNLAILELTEISNSKATLRLTELYLSAIMNWAKQNRRARQILIVLEEAHTIIPETAGAGFDYDTQWVVNRIGQISLQGRKYGVGLLVISQRTALVSKTILSQCNTFLTHSLIDQTSLRFLDSVYSSQHTKIIPNLGKFEFLAYGKAIRAERPILLKREFDPAKQAASDALRRPITIAEDTGPMTEDTTPE